jgi:hypothetical protein
MWQDPIVEEIHQIRHALAAQCNNDLSKLVERAMQRQQERARLAENVASMASAPVKTLLVGAQLHK